MQIGLQTMQGVSADRARQSLLYLATDGHRVKAYFAKRFRDRGVLFDAVLTAYSRAGCYDGVVELFSLAESNLIVVTAGSTYGQCASALFGVDRCPVFGEAQCTCVKASSPCILPKHFKVYLDKCANPNAIVGGLDGAPLRHALQCLAADAAQNHSLLTAANYRAVDGPLGSLLDDHML